MSTPQQQSLFDDTEDRRQVLIPVRDFYNDISLSITIEQVRQLPGKALLVELTFTHQWCRMVAHARGNIARALLRYSRPGDEATIKAHLEPGTESASTTWLGTLAMDVVYLNLKGLTHRLQGDHRQ